jgi:hypothetical protein
MRHFFELPAPVLFGFLCAIATDTSPATAGATSSNRAPYPSSDCSARHHHLHPYSQSSSQFQLGATSLSFFALFSSTHPILVCIICCSAGAAVVFRSTLRAPPPSDDSFKLPNVDHLCSRRCSSSSSLFEFLLVRVFFSRVTTTPRFISESRSFRFRL